MRDALASLVPTSERNPAGLVGLAELFVRRARWTTLSAVLLLIVASITEGASILVLVPLLQLLQKSGQDWSVDIPLAQVFGGGVFHAGLIEALTALCLLVIVQTLLARSKNIVLSRLLQSVVNRLRLELFGALARARWQFAGRIRAADLNTLLTSDIDRVQGAAFNFLQLVNTTVIILVYIGVSLMISPVMTFIAAAIGAAIFLVMHPIRKLASVYGRKLMLQRQEQVGIVLDFISGMKIAKSFNAEHRHLDSLSQNLGRTEAELARFIGATSAGSAALQIANVVALSCFIYCALAFFSLPAERLVVLVVLYLRLSPRFTALQACIQEILVCGPTLGMIAEVRARAIENEEAHGAEPAFCGKFGEIRFDRVAYSYDSAGELGGVREASFRIRNNCITALIGPSGAGKSTLADLIMGLLEEQSGAILIDGKPLTGANRKAWRDLIAYVPQDTFLLHDTIAANLRLGRPQASEEELWSALKMANAETFVRAMPAGLQSVVGDRGGLLSGGERQRIALARAVLRRPKLLVLDEATNALDPETQRSINRSIMALRSEMAIVIIAHHPGMIAAADDVITIEAGCVVEAGATDLLRENPDSRLSRFAAMTGVS